MLPVVGPAERPTTDSTPVGERGLFQDCDLRRRAFLRLAGMGVAATQFGVMGTARAQSDQSTPADEGEITAAAAATLPDYAPVPRSALGPALNDRGYFVGRVERNLYWVTDGTYQAAFLTTRDGVLLFDAPASIGSNLQRAVDEIAAANGVSNKVTHLVYSHHHADHAAASSLFGNNVVRIGQAETRRLLLRDNDPRRPPTDDA